MRKILIISLVCGLLLGIASADNTDNDGLSLIPSDTWVKFIQPRTEVIIITNAHSWDKIVKFHAPEMAGKKIMGIAIYASLTNRSVILIPVYIGMHDNPHDFMETLGYEVLHILDFYGGQNFFNPDLLEFFSTK